MKTEQLDAFLVSENRTLVDAMQQIDRNGVGGILFVTEENRKLRGVITDGDIRRWLIRTGNLHQDVGHVMNREAKAICRKDITNAKEELTKRKITALPVVNSKGIIQDIIFREGLEGKLKEETMFSEIPVVIMAGGKGTRLYPYTKILPKPLIPIGDIPIMERIIEKFCAVGAKTFYVTVNYRKEMLKSYFSEVANQYNIVYIEEDKPLGTAGSLQLISPKFDRPFIVTNCDILVQADYTDIYKYHQEAENDLTIVTALKNMIVPYGVIHAGENGVVDSMEEKPKMSYFVNTGMYILNPNLLREIPEDTFYHMTDLANKLLEENRRVGMYPISEDSFLDMGEFEEMHRMEKKLNLITE